MHGPLSLAQLRDEVAAGRIEDVIVALPDLQGRLQGSRLGPRYFLDHVLPHGFDCCTYLLAVDVDMVTAPGYALSPEATGFPDFTVVPDLSTLRGLPWLEGSALVIGDACWADGSPVAVAPRQVLHDQLDRLAALGLEALAGIELELLVFRESYQQAWERGYAGLTPATRHNVDYALQGLTDMEPMLRRLRREMSRAGLEVESARAECHPGQYELVFRYGSALRTCDDHVLYKWAAKEIAAQEGMAITFMAKHDTGEGNSCHVHFSLRGRDGTPVMAGDRGGLSPLMEQVIAGQLACLADLTLLFAPTVNSYKRLRPGAFAPTTLAWGRDNRSCPVRIVGTGSSLRIEHRVAGGDANPYLVLAAMVAGAMHGITERLPLEPACEGDAVTADRPRLPATLRDAVERFEDSAVARKAFGDDVVDHYATAGRAELSAFEAAVTDWERARGFERR